MGNRQVPDLSFWQIDSEFSSEQVPVDCWGVRGASNVHQVVQHLQLASRFGGMEREEKGVLRTPPRQVVKWVERCGQWHRISWCQRGRPLLPHQLVSTWSQRSSEDSSDVKSLLVDADVTMNFKGTSFWSSV